MKFIKLKCIFHANKHSTLRLDKNHAIEVFDSGNIGNIKVRGEVIAQLRFYEHSEEAKLFLNKFDGVCWYTEHLPCMTCPMSHHITALRRFVPNNVLTLLKRRYA